MKRMAFEGKGRSPEPGKAGGLFPHSPKGSLRGILAFLVLLSLACRALIPTSTPVGSPSPVIQVTLPVPSTTPTLLPSPAASPTASPPLATPTSPAGSDGYQVRFHPDGPLYVGDQVSFEVLAPPGMAPDGKEIYVRLADLQSSELAQAKFSGFGIKGRLQATLIWAWDTRGLDPGPHKLAFSVRPEGPSWTETVVLLPTSALPLSEARASWAEARSQCCVIHYVTGTAAGRDLPQLLDEMDGQASDAVRRIGIEFSNPITVTLLPRVLGQGGFTTSEISVSYLDRNYTGEELFMVLHHEMIHILDARLGGELRPSLLAEGLAVYLSGGHYKPEPLMARAATLLDTWGMGGSPGLNWYLPLKSLADDFYNSQHEIGYLEAAALIEFMVQTWGWDKFSEFYRDIHPQPNGSQAKAIDVALQKHFSLSIDELEARFIAALRQQPVIPGMRDEVRLDVRFYDAVRRYQQLLDPSAYFQNAWLMDNQEMRRRGIVADYLRHPDGPLNLTLETLLFAAGQELDNGEYPAVGRSLTAINAVLDAVEADQPRPYSADPLAGDYYAIVQYLLANRAALGLGIDEAVQPQRIQVEGDQAQAWIGSGGSALLEVNLERVAGSWQVKPASESQIKNDHPLHADYGADDRPQLMGHTPWSKPAVIPALDLVKALEVDHGQLKFNSLKIMSNGGVQ